jgi:dihydrofolate synthase / folylpolyglutamate synthase
MTPQPSLAPDIALSDVAKRLQKYERFGIDLGLDRILSLLERLGNPHQRVPVIHVAGTNGKGSVCAYLSSVLTAAGYKVGRYTSPHLIDWTERVTLNQQPISSNTLLAALQQVEQAIDPTQPTPTQFEVLTAAAWCIFAEAAVDVAVIEVGLGGRLDATNVCDRPLASLIISLSREHWQRLGPTLADIAREKAGILKAGCPAIIGPLPAEALQVVQERVAKLNCPAQWVNPAQWIQSRTNPYPWAIAAEIAYPLPLLGDMQLTNSALAIATVKTLRQQGWSISDEAIQTGMANTQWSGRLQWTEWQGMKLLIDGAHNPAAAKVLRQYLDQYLDQQTKPVHWLMGMLSTKDHGDIFEALLRPGDRVTLVPVVEHSTADPQELAQLALKVCPELETCNTAPSLIEGLQRLEQERRSPDYLPVLCGSLYLVGEFLSLQTD